MNSHTLTERYVAAAMRTVPESQRDDLAAELRASISDQVDALVESGEPAEAAERAVLTELGDPDKLAAGYTDRVLWLIGPGYYLEWWRLLKLLAWILIPLTAFGVALGQALAGESFGVVAGTTVVALIGLVVHLFFWTTLVFALVERHSETQGPLVSWTPDSLPDPSVSRVSVGEFIAAVVGLVFAAGAATWDHFIGFVPGVQVSFLDPSLWPAGIAYALVIGAIDAALLLGVYLLGRWTWGLAVVRAVLTLAVTIPALWLLIDGRLINPEFFPTVIPKDGEEVGQILSILAGFAIGGVATWSIVDTFLKARRDNR